MKVQISITIDSEVLDIIKRLAIHCKSNTSELLEISAKQFFKSKKGRELFKAANMIIENDPLRGLK